MTERRRIELTVNGEAVSCDVDIRKNLVDFIREDLGLTGTHVGCEHGVCGACTIRLDRRSARGYLIFAVQAEGCEVQTIEGLAESGEITDLQTAFLERNAAQCGFCTPGMLVTAAEILAKGNVKGREEIRDFISGNVCRCTGYHAIVDAIESVVKRRSKS